MSTRLSGMRQEESPDYAEQVTFPPVQARYVELGGVQGGNGYVAAAEINVIGSPAFNAP
jgi:hypothetical protein